MTRPNTPPTNLSTYIQIARIKPSKMFLHLLLIIRRSFFLLRRMHTKCEVQHQALVLTLCCVSKIIPQRIVNKLRQSMTDKMCKHI